MHLSIASSWVIPWDIPWNPRGMVQFWSFFFDCRRRELFSFRNNLVGPQGHIHGICSSFGQWYITLGQTFCASLYFNLIPNFDIMLWVFIPAPREGLFIINFIPFTTGFEWFLSVTINNSPVVKQWGSKS